MYFAFSIIIFVLLLLAALLLFRSDERGFALAALVLAIIWGITRYVSMPPPDPNSTSSFSADTVRLS